MRICRIAIILYLGLIQPLSVFSSSANPGSVPGPSEQNFVIRDLLGKRLERCVEQYLQGLSLSPTNIALFLLFVEN